MATTAAITGIGGTGESPNYLVVGLAVGIPCGVIILLLLILIVVMLMVTTYKPENEEIEAMYARRRFQGLSLEQQRQLQRTKKGRFRRRRSTATTASRPSIPSSIQSNSDPRKSRVRKENPFKLQDWQLKLSGIDVTLDNEETEETDTDSPIGAINPMLIQDDDEPDYEPVRRESTKKVNIVEQSSRQSHSSIQPAPMEMGGSDSNSSDSFNPYD